MLLVYVKILTCNTDFSCIGKKTAITHVKIRKSIYNDYLVMYTSSGRCEGCVTVINADRGIGELRSNFDFIHIPKNTLVNNLTQFFLLACMCYIYRVDWVLWVLISIR